MQNIALVLGTTGGIGGAVAAELLRRGWRVRALCREIPSAETAARLPGCEWIRGDAMNEHDTATAATRVSVIFHGVHPPHYLHWRERSFPMLHNALQAARANGAVFAFPGNVYNFGPDISGPISEDAAQRPVTKKGLVRVEMEESIRAASADGLRAIVVRAGDFFGGHAPSSWLQNGMVKPGRPVRSVVYPGQHEVGHAWAYLPDLAATFVKLIERADELPRFTAFHFRGHYLPRGVEMAEAILTAAGIDPTHAKIKALPWGAIRVLSPLVPSWREMLEMRYLWNRSLELDNRKLVAFLGSEPHTPLISALRTSLGELGCLPGADGRAALGGGVVARS